MILAIMLLVKILHTACSWCS